MARRGRINLGYYTLWSGRLDEAIYGTVPAISDFVQQDPQEGEPATEKTEAWIFYDDANLYVAARIHESFRKDGSGEPDTSTGPFATLPAAMAVLDDSARLLMNALGLDEAGAQLHGRVAVFLGCPGRDDLAVVQL